MEQEIMMDTAFWVSVFCGGLLGALVTSGVSVWLDYRRFKKQDQQYAKDKFIEFVDGINAIPTTYKLIVYKAREIELSINTFEVKKNEWSAFINKLHADTTNQLQKVATLKELFFPEFYSLINDLHYHNLCTLHDIECLIYDADKIDSFANFVNNIQEKSPLKETINHIHKQIDLTKQRLFSNS